MRLISTRQFFIFDARKKASKSVKSIPPKPANGNFANSQTSNEIIGTAREWSCIHFRKKHLALPSKTCQYAYISNFSFRCTETCLWVFNAVHFRREKTWWWSKKKRYKTTTKSSISIQKLIHPNQHQLNWNNKSDNNNN